MPVIPFRQDIRKNMELQRTSIKEVRNEVEALMEKRLREFTTTYAAGATTRTDAGGGGVRSGGVSGLARG
jgi:hypothetical protein